MNREYKQWNIEKKLIPKMIRIYCRGNHKEIRKEEGVKGKETMVSQNTYLFEETIEDNLRIAKPDAHRKKSKMLAKWRRCTTLL